MYHSSVFSHSPTRTPSSGWVEGAGADTGIGTGTGAGSETDTGTDTSTDTSTDAPAVCCSCDPLDCQPWTFSEQVCEVDQSNAQGEPLVWCELSVFGSPLECEAECNAM